jgi:hypothetical protein
VGSEVLTAVVIKSAISWDIKPCSPLKVNWRFGGTYRLHLHGLKINRALLATCFHAGILLGLFLDSEDGGDMFLRNGWFFSGLQCVISQKIVHFIHCGNKGGSSPPSNVVRYVIRMLLDYYVFSVLPVFIHQWEMQTYFHKVAYTRYSIPWFVD